MSPSRLKEYLSVFDGLATRDFFLPAPVGGYTAWVDQALWDWADVRWQLLREGKQSIANELRKRMRALRKQCEAWDGGSRGKTEFRIQYMGAELSRFATTFFGGAKKGARAKRRRTAAIRPLTDLQRQAFELHGTHNGKLAEVARAMGVTHATAHGHLKAAWQKLGEIAPRRSAPAGRTKRLPTDHRGQVEAKDRR